MPANDPRRYPPPATVPPSLARLHALANASLAATDAQQADAQDREIRAAFMGWLRFGAGEQLARAFELAPTGPIYRHLWRLLVEQEQAGPSEAALTATIFALPIVIVAGRDAPATDTAVLGGVVPDIAELAAILRNHAALAGNQTFTFANVLVSADALAFAHLPALYAWRLLPETTLPPRILVPSAVTVAAGAESAHLRFLVGSALAAPGVNVLRDEGVGKWGMPMAQALSRQLATPGVSLLALPRAPQSPTLAVARGRKAQREVGAQLFAGHAIRKLRAAVGEPTAVISIHQAGEQGGEVRLSLSSPFAPREAEGFRWPLEPLDRVDDVINTLRELLQDCRVTDVRVEPGTHADRDPDTGLTLFFKGDGATARNPVH